MNRNSPLKCVQHHRRVVPYLEKKEQSSIAYSNVVEDTLSRSESTADPVPDREVLLGVDIFHPTKVRILFFLLSPLLVVFLYSK